MALLTAASSLSTSLSIRAVHSSPSGSQVSRSQSANNVPLSIRSSSSLPSLDLTLCKEQVETGSKALAGAMFATMATSGSAAAAQEVLNMVAAAAQEGDDKRGLALLLTLVPAIGWVLFNILRPGLNQLDKMRSAKAMAIGIGIGAAVLAAPPAFAAAAPDNDSRGTLLLFVLFPAIGWVLYNILRPALNQLDKMRSTQK